MPNWAWAKVSATNVNKEVLSEYLNKYTYINDEGERYISSAAVAGIDQKTLATIPEITSKTPFQPDPSSPKHIKLTEGKKLFESLISEDDGLPTFSKRTIRPYFEFVNATPSQIQKLKEILKPLGIDIFKDDVTSLDQVQKTYELIHNYLGYEGTTSPFDWYSFNCQHIGTKWEFEFNPEIDDEGNVALSTTTAWACPDEVFQHMANKLGVDIVADRTWEGSGEWVKGNNGNDEKASDYFDQKELDEGDYEFNLDDNIYWKDEGEILTFSPEEQESTIERQRQQLQQAKDQAEYAQAAAVKIIAARDAKFKTSNPKEVLRDFYAKQKNANDEDER